MKLQNVARLIGIGAIAFIMAGCGGGGSNAENSPSETPTGATGTTRGTGGTTNKPTLLSVTSRNYISPSSTQNYFKYTGSENTKLIMNVTLDRELTADEEYIGRFIQVFDTEFNSLPLGGYDSLKRTYELPYDGTFIIQFDYPTTGYVEVSEIVIE